MKLIIEISEKEYNEIKENKYGVFSGHIFQTIRNGVPLKLRDSRLFNDDVFKDIIGDLSKQESEEC